MLTNAGNDFTGAVSLTTTGANAASITDKNALTLGTTSVGGDLTAISTGTLNLGAGAVGGALAATSNGSAITQAGALTVTGASSINAGANAITLTNAGNDFIGAVSLTTTGVNAASLTDKNALILGTSDVGGDLAATVGAGITQTGRIIVGGVTTLTADTNPGQIADLSSTANFFAKEVSSSTANGGSWMQVNLGASTGLILGNITTDSSSALIPVDKKDSKIIATSLGTLSGNGTLNAMGPSTFTVGTGAGAITRTPIRGTVVLSAQTPRVDSTSLVLAGPAPTNMGLLALFGDVPFWNLGGFAPIDTQALNTSWSVRIGGALVQAGALGSALTSAVGAAQASALAAAAGEAKKSFGTDSVAQQIDYGFAGDIGVAPTMAHQVPLEGETISVPACTTESKNAQACK
jgi:hypothetical protein